MYSVVITSYECNGKGVSFLGETLKSVFNQTYRPIQCIVSDHSKNNEIENMVKTLSPSDIDFKYVRYADNYGNPCHNWNNGLQYVTGDYIHYLAMDDMLAYADSVANIMNQIKMYPKSRWFACAHITYPLNKYYIPEWNAKILYGKNLLSGPSAIIINKNLRHIKLDPQFIWFLDVDWYYRLFLEADKPKILWQPLFINRTHADQLTNTVCNNNLIIEETSKLQQKYGNPLPLAKSFKYHPWNNMH